MLTRAALPIRPRSRLTRILRTKSGVRLEAQYAICSSIRVDETWFVVGASTNPARNLSPLRAKGVSDWGFVNSEPSMITCI